MSRAPTAITRSAPGKVLLFGEHAVVYGHPAVGVPLSRRATITLTAGDGKLEVRLAQGIEVTPSARAATPEDLVTRALGALRPEVDVTATLEFPPMSGFGSSAALGVALVDARHAYAGTRPPRSLAGRLEEVLAVETVAHARPSGVDPAVVLTGGPVLFRRTPGGPRVRRLRLARPVAVVVGAAGHHGGTVRSVSRVAELRSAAPRLVESAMAALGATAEAGAAALTAGDLTLAGGAMDLAHGVLSGLGLVAERVDAAVRTARGAGAFGAKMSGAGGDGGAFVGLCADPDAALACRDALLATGCTAWVELLEGSPRGARPAP